MAENKEKAVLFWVDLEMTGLDVSKDKIIEVAAIATDWEFNEIAKYESAVRVEPELLKERMVGEFWDKHDESRKGLIAENADGENSKEVETDLVKFLDENFGETIYLAGNSVHNDRKFIDKEWPKVSERLHYRILDVSAWKVYFEGALGKKFVKREEHRAMDDIRGSMEELKYYLGFLKK